MKLDAKTLQLIQFALGQLAANVPALVGGVQAAIAALEGHSLTAEQKAAIDAAYETAFQHLMDATAPKA